MSNSINRNSESADSALNSSVQSIERSSEVDVLDEDNEDFYSGDDDFPLDASQQTNTNPDLFNEIAEQVEVDDFYAKSQSESYELASQTLISQYASQDPSSQRKYIQYHSNISSESQSQSSQQPQSQAQQTTITTPPIELNSPLYSQSQLSQLSQPFTLSQPLILPSQQLQFSQFTQIPSPIPTTTTTTTITTRSQPSQPSQSPQPSQLSQPYQPSQPFQPSQTQASGNNNAYSLGRFVEMSSGATEIIQNTQGSQSILNSNSLSQQQMKNEDDYETGGDEGDVNAQKSKDIENDSDATVSQASATRIKTNTNSTSPDNHISNNSQRNTNNNTQNLSITKKLPFDIQINSSFKQKSWIIESILRELSPANPSVQIVTRTKQSNPSDVRLHSNVPQGVNYVVSDGSDFIRCIVSPKIIHNIMFGLGSFVPDHMIGGYLRLKKFMIFPNDTFSEFDIYVDDAEYMGHSAYIENYSHLKPANKHQQVLSIITRINPCNFFATSYPSTYVSDYFKRSNTNPEDYDISIDECIISEETEQYLAENDPWLPDRLITVPPSDDALDEQISGSEHELENEAGDGMELLDDEANQNENKEHEQEQEEEKEQEQEQNQDQDQYQYQEEHEQKQEEEQEEEKEQVDQSLSQSIDEDLTDDIKNIGDSIADDQSDFDMGGDFPTVSDTEDASAILNDGSEASGNESENENESESVSDSESISISMSGQELEEVVDEESHSQQQQQSLLQSHSQSQSYPNESFVQDKPASLQLNQFIVDNDEIFNYEPQTPSKSSPTRTITLGTPKTPKTPVNFNNKPVTPQSQLKKRISEETNIDMDDYMGDTPWKRPKSDLLNMAVSNPQSAASQKKPAPASRSSTVPRPTNPTEKKNFYDSLSKYDKNLW